MAGSVSAPLDTHAEHFQEAPTTANLVERLTQEGFISMRDAAALYGRKTHKSTPTRHALNGVKLADGTRIRLEAIRVSGSLVTSKAAVLRFFAAQNQLSPAAASPVTPATHNRAAVAASKQVDAALGTKKKPVTVGA
jgi:hypothetical protein